MNWPKLVITGLALSVLISADALPPRSAVVDKTGQTAQVEKAPKPKSTEAVPSRQNIQVQRSQQEDRPATEIPARQAGQQERPQSAAPMNANLSEDEQEMLTLVNRERLKNGLKPLSINIKLANTARTKARDMLLKNYFSHNSPTFGSPFDMIKSFGITYRTAGENLAGAGTTEKAHKNLMDSPGHRSNILNSNYREIGIGIVSGGPYGKIFVQLFIG